MRLKPMTQHIFLRELAAKSETTKGILIPESARKGREATQGIVLAVGPGYPKDDGTFTPIYGVEVGMHLVIQPSAGMESTFDDETFLVINPRDIIGVIEDETN